jgi:hypothetical protein
MSEFEIVENGKKIILDVSGFTHIFVCEDETCAEITITKTDITRLKKAIWDYENR